MAPSALPRPGESLDEHLDKYHLSQRGLANRIGVPPRRINEIIRGLRAITPDTSLRLGRVFGVPDDFFLTLQLRYDLDCARAAIDLSEITPLAEGTLP